MLVFNPFVLSGARGRTFNSAFCRFAKLSLLAVRGNKQRRKNKSEQGTNRYRVRLGVYRI
jgi:hypothetical protein